MGELNVRAAKALGWKYTYQPDRLIIPEDSVPALGLPGFHQTVLETDLKFTTSYDWAMLGVKKAYEKNADWMLGKWISMMSDLHNMPSPLEITQAWVEVLENA